MMISDWFQQLPIPDNAMTGTYNMYLVALSYVIAVLASYVALDLVGRLREEKNPHAKLYWLFGGAFAMGAGIWSMHFIGMLAFIMPMPMGYDFFWTGSSLLVAILVSGFALFILREKNRSVVSLAAAGVLIGLGIATMHYMGMHGMTDYVNIRYLPGLFFISIAIAIIAAEAALWLALQSNQAAVSRQFLLKIISALIMGIAICGMHYTGMAAAVFTPLADDHMAMMMSGEKIRPDLLAVFVAGITGLIISLALTVSTYYKNMVLAVQDEKEFLNAMLDNLEDGIIACDSHGKITVFNDTLQKNVQLSSGGQSLADLSNYFDLYSLDSSIPLENEELPLCRALHGERIHEIEYIMKFKNNKSYNVVIDGQPIIGANGNKLGAVIAIHDITEIKKTEIMKNEFVSVVSHELRTPLTSIRGSLGLLLGGMVGEFSDKAAKLLDIANKNCDRLLLLINDILDMEKIQAGKMKFDLQLIDIEKIVSESIATNKMYGEQYGVALELIEPVDHAVVYVDPDRLAQVLTNLISNAAKFSAKGSVIEVKIVKDNETVRVAVIDKGAGIPVEFQARIFEKFSQADSSDTRGKGGTGLGLSISKAIIEHLGGSLNFVSKPETGTTFYFDLPVNRIHEDIEKIVKKVSPDTAKLLICEDDEDQAKYLSVLLESAGLHTDIANTVKQAKRFLDKNQYRAMILDLILPDEDGITFIKELRKSEKTRELPIIVISMITAAGQELLNGDAVLVLDWLDKPVNFNKLLEAISRIKQTNKSSLPHVLHVEDDDDTRHVVATLLEKEAKVTPSSTINEAIQRLGQDRYDLVILDLALPDGKGSDLLPIFSKYKLPIIVYSAFDLDEESSKFVSQSLVKSKTSNEELLKTIKALLVETNKDAEYAE